MGALSRFASPRDPTQPISFILQAFLALSYHPAQVSQATAFEESTELWPRRMFLSAATSAPKEAAGVGWCPWLLSLVPEIISG